MSPREREALILSLRRSGLFTPDICDSLEQTDEKQLKQFELYRKKIQFANRFSFPIKTYSKISSADIKVSNETTLSDINIEAITIAQASYIALSGNTALIKVIADYFYNPQRLPDERTKTFALFLVLSGNIQIIQEVLHKYSNFRNSTTKNGANILHCAAFSGNVDIIEYVLQACPDLKNSRANDGNNILHYAALSGNVDATKYVLKTCPELKYSDNNIEENIIHLAAFSGNVDTIKYVLRTCSEFDLRDSLTKDESDILHYAAWSGNVDAIQYVFQIRPDSDNTNKNNRGRNILYFATQSGNVDAIQYVLQTYPGLKNSTSNSGKNILHWAASYGHVHVIEYLIMHYPKLTATLLARQDNYGDSPDSYAISKKISTPTQLVRKKIQQILLMCCQRILTEQECELLAAFKEQCLNVLCDSETFESAEQFDSTLKNGQLAKLVDVSSVKPMLEVRKLGFETKDKPIEYTNLSTSLKLLRGHTEQSSSYLSYFWSSPPQSIFHQQLAKLCQSIQEQSPDTLKSEKYKNNIILTLGIIIDDFEGTKDKAPLEKEIAKVLIMTQSISDLRPKAAKSQELNINANNQLALLKKIKDASTNCSEIGEDTRKNSLMVIEGVRRTAHPTPEEKTSREDIIKHLETNFGGLYYLDDEEKLPLHTDHTEMNRTDDFEKLLDRLVENFIGAYDIATKTGRAAQFFEKLTLGFCLEGRTRDTFSWAAGLSEIKTFHDCMETFLNKCTAYHAIMNPEIDITSTANVVEAWIVKRYKSLPCLPDAEFAPKGEIAQEGVHKYLEEILYFEFAPKSDDEVQVVSKGSASSAGSAPARRPNCRLM